MIHNAIHEMVLNKKHGYFLLSHLSYITLRKINVIVMSTQLEILHSDITSLLSTGHGRDEIISQLSEKGHDKDLIHDAISEVIKQRNAVSRAQGLNLVLSGAVICFLSFLLTITSSFSHSSFPYVLYGLTSVGIGIAFAGFMKVF